MMCSGARDYKCWNASTFDGHDAARRIARAVLAMAESFPDFDADFLAHVEESIKSRKFSRASELSRLDERIAGIGRELSNLVEVLGRVGFSETLGFRLAELEAEKSRLTVDRLELLGRPEELLALPGIEELKKRAQLAIGKLAFDEPEFGRLMRRLIPRMIVSPFQAIDGGAVVLRAEIEVGFGPLLGLAHDDLGSLVVRTATVDLFDQPQRISLRNRIVALRDSGRTERDAATELGVTVTAAQAAMKLHRRMTSAGMTDPYRRLTAPPADSRKLRRHRHPRYRFEPIETSRP
jgi:hypothetical protein